MLQEHLITQRIRKILTKRMSRSWRVQVNHNNQCRKKVVRQSQNHLCHNN